jgi:glycosyltransferase involved in cell wall biosynthesis
VALRVTHCPVNLAGVGWTNVQALRRRGVDARLVVFNTQPFRPDQADWNLKRPRKGLLRQQLVQWRALSKLLPKTDIFHFYFGLTLVPKSLQFPILKATRRKSLFHFLGADIRERPKEELMYGLKADARIVGSFAALNFIPYEAEVLPPGIELDRYEPVSPVERERVRIVHAPSNKEKKGTEYVIEACKQLPVDLDIVHGVRNEEALERYKQADIVVDQLNAGWYGVFAIECMALGKPVVTFLQDEAVARTERELGVRVPIVNATAETLRERLEPLVASAAERRRIGAESRAYAEAVHDSERVADRLLALYARLMRRPEPASAGSGRGDP